jgi:hypothetical protein
MPRLNVFAAKEIIARREGVKEHEVQRVFQINEDSSSSSDSGEYSSGGDFDLGGIAALCLFLLGAWIFVTFWPIILVLGIIGLIYWVYKIVSEDD